MPGRFSSKGPWAAAKVWRLRPQAAAVAVARKLTDLLWHLLIEDVNYLSARPALVASWTNAQAAYLEANANIRCRKDIP